MLRKKTEEKETLWKEQGKGCMNLSPFPEVNLKSGNSHKITGGGQRCRGRRNPADNT
jgi:hypothetical protein